jgi:hypothetical protein
MDEIGARVEVIGNPGPLEGQEPLQHRHPGDAESGNGAQQRPRRDRPAGHGEGRGQDDGTMIVGYEA